MKKVLVINANPKSESLCRAMAEHYEAVAGGSNDLKLLHVGEMDFDPNLREGYDAIMPLEPDLVAFQAAVEWADHLVIVSPVWWGTTPALFKGLLDRAFLPGFAFKYEEGKTIPRKLLKGRTAELLITMDTPVFWYRFVYGNPLYKQLKNTVLEFSGIKVTGVSYFGPVIHSGEKRRAAWMQKVWKLAARL